MDFHCVHFEVSSSGLNVQVSGTTAECKKCRGKPGDDRSFNGGVIQLRPLPLKPYGELLGEIPRITQMGED